MSEVLKQNLIDPELCIRCYTCEEMCPAEAISHDGRNVVVEASKCNYCMACITPCPTGSIDNWRAVRSPYSIAEQLSWSELPAQQALKNGADETAIEALDDTVAA